MFIPFHQDEKIFLTLSELRTCFSELTQEQLAARLGTSQAAVSAFEGRADVKVSKLITHLRALNAELELTAKFKTGHSVRLKQFMAPPADDRYGSDAYANDRTATEEAPADAADAERDNEAWLRLHALLAGE